MAFQLVEIKCEETLAFYQGYVKDVDRDLVLVAYEGGWQRDAWLSVSSLRPSLAPYNAAQFLPSPGEVVEVKAKSAEHEPYSWWRGSVKSVRANPAALEETDGVVDSLGSTAKALIYEISYAGWENEFTETLEKEMLRPFNKQPCFAVGDIEKHTLPIAPHLAQALTPDVLANIHYEANTLALVVEPAGSLPSVPSPSAAFAPPPAPSTQPTIVVIGSKPNCQRAVILLAQRLQQLNEQQQQQQQQLQQQQQYMQQQQQHQQHDRYHTHDRYDSQGHSALASHHHKQPLPQQHHHQSGAYGQQHEQLGPYGQQSQQQQQHGQSFSYPPSQHSYGQSQSLPYPSSTPPVSLEFHCPPHLMGMVIGKRHKNLYIAENLDGIHKVHVDTENGSIVVIAKTAEAAASARSLLELTEQTLHIPSVIVGRVVGKNFAIIKEIEQHSGVLRIKVGDDRDHDLEYLQQIALHGIPGVSNLDEHGNPLPNPAAAALQAAAASAAADKDTQKRSAFDRPYQYRERGGRDRRGGYGRHGDDAAPPEPEEFDLISLEDDKTVEISIIGSPATVSEAELLLRTHIGLITQIYKLSYDEAMLERQVNALNLVCPVKLALGGERSERGERQAAHGGEHRHHADKRRGATNDKPLPVWMNEGANSGKDEKRRNKEADPSVDIHAARLKGAAAGAPADKKSAAAPSGNSASASVPSYKNAAVAGAVADAASSSAPTAPSSSQSDESEAAGNAGNGRGGNNAPRKRGGRKEAEKKQRREQRNQGKDGAAAGGDSQQQGQSQQDDKQKQQQRGRGRFGKRRGDGGGGGGENGAEKKESNSAAAAGGQ